MMHVNRYKTILGLIVFILLVPFLSYANVTQSVQTGTQWLLNQQNPDGSFGNELDAIPLLTVESIITLQTQPNTEIQVANAIDFLINYTPDNNDYLSRILYATRNNVFLQSLLDSQNSDSGWGLLHGFKSEPQDTARALQALKAVNYPDQNVIYSAINYLKSNQNADGGWGLKQGDDSEVYYTALILTTLSQFKSIYDLQTEINNSVSYLLAHQNPEGRFGEGTVYETALAFIALIESGSVGAENYAALQNTIAYLTSTQLPNGSWNDDPYSTALALRALANVKPNLSISSSDITFSNPTPTVGETITKMTTSKMFLTNGGGG